MTKFLGRIFLLLCTTCALFPAVSFGQMTQITGTGLRIGSSLISTGTVCAVAVDSSENPIVVAINGGGQQGIGQSCGTIAAGTITGAVGGGTYTVADEGIAYNPGFYYTVTVSDTSKGNFTSGQSYQLHKVPLVTGTTFALDHYFPTTTTSTLPFFTFTTGFGPPSVLTCSGKSFYQDNTTPSAPILYSCGSDLNYHVVSGSGIPAGTGLVKTVSGVGTLAVAGTDYATPASVTASTVNASNKVTETFTVGATAVIANELVRLDTSGNVVPTLTTDTGSIGIAETSAATGTSVVVDELGGVFSCVADNATTINDLFTVGSTTAATCRDSGTSLSSGLPITQAKLGKFLTATPAGSTASVFLYGPGHQGTQISAITPNPSTSQTVTQPTGTTLNVTGTLKNNGQSIVEGPFNSYVAFGDSITYGAYTMSRYSAYPSVVGRYLGVTPNNLGVSGSTSNSTDSLIFSTSASGGLPQTNTGVITYQTGTNNARLDAGDANQAADFGQNILAQGAFLSIPTANKVLATSFAKTGTWGTGVFSPDISTSTLGNTASFTVTGPVVYLATVIQSSVNTASATLSCDGTATGATLYFSGIGGVSPINGPQTSLTRVAGLSNTAHSCVVAVTSSSGTVELSWAAGLSGQQQSSYPYLFQGGIPDENPDAPTLENPFRAYIPTMVSTLYGDGLNVYFANTNATLTPPNDYVDTLHPIDHGYYLLGQAFIGAIQSVTNSPTVNPPYFGSYVTSNVYGGASNMLLGYNTNSTITGFGNTGVGYNAGTVISTGSGNTIFGGAAGQSLTTGGQNSLVGYETGLSLTTGSGNVGDGALSLASGVSEINNTAIGWSSLKSSNTSGNTCVGYQCGYPNSTNATTVSSNQTYVGLMSGASTPSATTLTNSGAFGANSLVGASGAYEIGTGACNTANALCFQGNQIANATSLIGSVLPSTIYSAAGTALPTCAVGIKGEQTVVSDATTPAYMGAYTSGGAITAAVICSYNGTTYSWLTH